MSIQSNIDQQISDSIAEALNENDIELVQWIEKFRETKIFGNGNDSQTLASNEAFKLACNEIINHINGSK